MKTTGHVLDLVNSRLERPAQTVEEMPDAAAAGRWLAERFGDDAGGGADGLREGEFEALLGVRTAIRSLMLDRIADRAPGAAALEILNEAATLAVRIDRLNPTWSADTTYVAVRSVSDLSQVVAREIAALAGQAIALLADPELNLAQCAADDCVVLFLRADPRRQWHDDRCGNRVRAARKYARSRGAVTDH